MENQRIVLCDTDVLIEFFKRNRRIVDLLHEIGEEFIAISAITKAELYYGARDKKELRTIKKHLSGLQTAHITESISKEAVALMEKYTLSHNLALPDSLIAATASVNDYHLLSLNKKDFHYIKGLKLLEP